MDLSRKSNRHVSSIQEKHIAKKMNGKLQPNSGATKFLPGDVQNDRFLFEAKTSKTDKKSYTIQKVVLEKLESERLQLHKDISALVFNFGPYTDNYYILTEKGIKALLKEIDNLMELQNQ